MRTVSEAETHGTSASIILTGDEEEGNLVFGVGSNLLLHSIIRVIELRSDSLLAKIFDELPQVVGELFCHRNADDLHRCEPCGKGPRVMLCQHSKEALNGSKESSVDHDGLLARTIGSLVLQLKSRGKVEVELNRRHLPAPPNRVARLNRNFRAIERGTTRIWHEIKTRLFRDRGQRGGRPLPQFVGADKFFTVTIPRGELEIEVGQTEIREEAQHKVKKRRELLLQLLCGDENVSVIHGETAHSGQTVNDTAFFVAIDGPKFEHA